MIDESNLLLRVSNRSKTLPLVNVNDHYLVKGVQARARKVYISANSSLHSLSFDLRLQSCTSVEINGTRRNEAANENDYFHLFLRDIRQFLSGTTAVHLTCYPSKQFERVWLNRSTFSFSDFFIVKLSERDYRRLRVRHTYYLLERLFQTYTSAVWYLK